MLQKETFQFLEQLKLNNNKEWMDANRKVYEAAKADYESFVTQIIGGLSKMEPLMGELTAKQCIFRLNRDVRFSNDKSPYKSHFGAYFSIGGKKSPHAGYYLHVEPGQSFIGGGCWMPEAAMLKGIRQEIDYDFDAFKAIIQGKSFKKLYPKIDGEQLKKAPQGYDVENPAIEYLKHKSFTVGHSVPDKEFVSKQAVDKVLSSFETMKPFIDFLNRAVE
ncbi:DUF2461 domain-containing protein [Taibaiella lutea]|uniref:DUF2461 domain-containing protein n=1 Tax=Taibaiella lutea TaxID=2608001 RepID=A0A5M6CNY6_9BACT|nr:DUF2461 domain-containing protein [Taibaiella lutea]KAA5536854.1 DUF2461 domain-containing protein [Taibaiella lutea]